MCFSSMKNHKGFSLVEMLIALVLGSILVSVLLRTALAVDRHYRHAISSLDDAQAVAFAFHVIRKAHASSQAPAGCAGRTQSTLAWGDTMLTIEHVRHQLFRANVSKDSAEVLLEAQKISQPFHRGDSVQVFSRDKAPMVITVLSVYHNRIVTDFTFHRSKAVWLADDHTIALKYSAQEQALRLKVDKASSRQWLARITRARFEKPRLQLCQKTRCYVLMLSSYALKES